MVTRDDANTRDTPTKQAKSAGEEAPAAESPAKEVEKPVKKDIQLPPQRFSRRFGEVPAVG
jgi:hypothetical protein